MHLDDPPQAIPASGWEYVDNGSAIRLLPAGKASRPTTFTNFRTRPKIPSVNGIGFAAVRDFNSFLRYAAADSGGTSNPLAGDVTRIYTFAFSQPARMLNDFRNLGFNEDENGKIVFDGMLQWIAAGDGINMNYRFSQPGRTERNRQDQLYAEGVFPFANQRTTDPITGKTAGRYDKCTATKTCPLAMEVYSANEYWVKAASLFTTDPAAPRIFPITRWPATISSPAISTAPAARREKATASSFRILWTRRRSCALCSSRWTNGPPKGIAPPPSEFRVCPTERLCRPLPQSAVGFPKIPGVTYTGLKSTRYLLNYGPQFYSTGIMTIDPPA